MTRAKREVIEPTTAVARATARLLGAPAGPSGPAASGHGKKTGNGGDGERVRYLTRHDRTGGCSSLATRSFPAGRRDQSRGSVQGLKAPVSRQAARRVPAVRSALREERCHEPGDELVPRGRERDDEHNGARPNFSERRRSFPHTTSTDEHHRCLVGALRLI